MLQCRSYLHYPADLYLEGSDQHRGWFQLSLLPALGATGQPPFKQVLTHGFVVKPDGTKVSKSDKEYVKAVDEINRHGADVLRLWCCSVDYQNDIPASPKAIKEFGDKYRKIRNTLRYLLANLYDFNPNTDAQPVPPNSLDGWAMCAARCADRASDGGVRRVPAPSRVPAAARFLLGADQRDLRQRDERPALLRSAELAAAAAMPDGDAPDGGRADEAARADDRLHRR